MIFDSVKNKEHYREYPLIYEALTCRTANFPHPRRS